MSLQPSLTSKLRFQTGDRLISDLHITSRFKDLQPDGRTLYLTLLRVQKVQTRINQSVVREREGDTERGRQRQRDRDRERHRDRETETETQ